MGDGEDSDDSLALDDKKANLEKNKSSKDKFLDRNMSGFAGLMQNLEYKQAMNNFDGTGKGGQFVQKGGGGSDDYSMVRGNTMQLSKRFTMNEMYDNMDHGIHPKERRSKQCQAFWMLFIYVCYLAMAIILSLELYCVKHRPNLLVEQDMGMDHNLIIIVKVYFWMLMTLFVVRIIYFSLQLSIWCNRKADPYQVHARRRFRWLMTLGLYEFIVFVTGLVLWCLTYTARVYIAHVLDNVDKRSDIIFCYIMTWMLLIHASIFTLYFLAYLLFLGAAYYYVTSYDGMKVEEGAAEDIPDEEFGTTKKRKQIAGIKAKTRSITKLGVQKQIEAFMDKHLDGEDQSGGIFLIKWKEHGVEGKVSYNQVGETELKKLEAAETEGDDDASSVTSSDVSVTNFTHAAHFGHLCCPICMCKIMPENELNIISSNIYILQNFLQKSEEDQQMILAGETVEKKFNDQVMHNECFIIMVQEIYAKDDVWALNKGK